MIADRRAGKGDRQSLASTHRGPRGPAQLIRALDKHMTHHHGPIRVFPGLDQWKTFLGRLG